MLWLEDDVTIGEVALWVRERKSEGGERGERRCVVLFFSSSSSFARGKEGKGPGRGRERRDEGGTASGSRTSIDQVPPRAAP
jgi:hypothetical protein